MEAILKLLLTNPDAITDIVKDYINKYKPVIYGIAQELANVYEDYANNKEYAATVAKAQKNFYDAYVNAGFSEDQAFALLIDKNIKFANSVKNYSNSLSNASKSMQK